MQFKKILPLEAQNILNNNSGILIDIRAVEDFNRSHDDRAISITQEDNLVNFINNTDKDIPVCVLCYHGNSSQSVAEFLAENGFTSVYSVDGGYEMW